MPSKFLTIVVPARNRPEFLGLCLRSIFDHKGDLPEVIVSDNSTHEVEGIRTLVESFPVSYVRQSGKLSMSDHHNACMTLPRTPWALLLHDDDELHPGVLNRLETFLSRFGDAGPEVGLIVGAVERIDHKSVVTGIWKPKKQMTLHGEEAALSLGLDFQAHPPSTIYNVKAFNEVGGFPDARGASGDFPLIVELAYKYGVTYFTDVIGRYRLGDHQATDYTLEGAERTLDLTIDQTLLVRDMPLEPRIADQLIDYNIWWHFRIIADSLFSTQPSFVLKLFRKCEKTTPHSGVWKSRIRKEYPLLFFPLPSVPLFIYRIGNRYLAVFLKRRLFGYSRRVLEMIR